MNDDDDDDALPPSNPPSAPAAPPAAEDAPSAARTAGREGRSRAGGEGGTVSPSGWPDPDFFIPPSSSRPREHLSNAPEAFDVETLEPTAGAAALSLTLIDPPKLLYERAEEATEDSPIVYRERGYLIDNLQSDDELDEQLARELSAIRESLRDRDAPQFIQLAFFDHELEGEPATPPLATLSWKDWQGPPEIWVRGVRRPRPPSEGPGDTDLDDAFVPLESGAPESSLIDSVPERPSDTATVDEGDGSIAEDAVTQRSDSGMSWQAPSRSGEYPVPEVDPQPESARSSQRVLAGADLMGALFESLNELLYLRTIAEGAEYVAETLARFVPCDGALIHVFDIDARHFVVVGAQGPNSKEVISRRTPDGSSPLSEALRRQAPVKLAGSAIGGESGWRALGLEPEHCVCCPVHQRGRYLGAVELARNAGGEPFSDEDLHALEYVCEQLGDFVVDRPLVVEPPSSAPPS